MAGNLPNGEVPLESSPEEQQLNREPEVPGHIPVIVNEVVDDINMNVDEPEETIEDLMRQHAEAVEQERINMENLCNQVMQVGLEQPDRENVDTFSYIVLSSRDIGKTGFEHNGVLIRWVTIRRNFLEEVKQIMIKFIEDPLKKCIIIDCLARFWLELKVPMNEVMNVAQGITARMRTIEVHRLVFSSEIFVPQWQRKWPWTASWNLFTRNLNIQMMMTPLSLHKALLRSVPKLAKMAVKGNCWSEFKAGTGLGTNLSQEGINCVTKWCAVHLISGMEKVVDHSTKLTVNDNEPTSLAYTPGYKTPQMVGYLKLIGMHTPNLSKESGYTRRNSYSKNKTRSNDRDRDPLRSDLSSIGRRSSSSGSASASSVFSYGRRDSRQDDLMDQVRLSRDNRDLANVVSSLKEDKEKEAKEGRDREEKLHSTIQRLFAEMEWMSRDRTELSGKLIKAEQSLQQVKEDRDALSDECRKLKKD